MSLSQVSAISGAPISGMTAIGAPSSGTMMNQGRVGLSQNCESKPVKYRTFGGAVRSSASKPLRCMILCARAVRSSNSACVKPRLGIFNPFGTRSILSIMWAAVR